MSPDAAPAPTQAEPPQAAPAPATEPAESGRATPAALPPLGTLKEAFRAAAEGGPALRGSDARASKAQGDQESPGGSSATSEESAATDAASKSGEQGPSRRGAAAAIKEKDAEIERLLQERLSEKARADAAAERMQALQQGQETARKAALERIGDDREFERLQQARLRNKPLSYEEEERFDKMLEWREHAATLWELADRSHKVSVATRLDNRVEKYGLDRETAFGADLVGLVDHAVAATEARVKRESASKIAELEAELKGLRPRAAAAGRAAPATGGRSAGGGALPEDGSSPLDFFKAGARQRDEGAARPGRAAGSGR